MCPKAFTRKLGVRNPERDWSPATAAIRLKMTERGILGRSERNGGLIGHDGRTSDWASEAANSRERAIWAAKAAIDTDSIG